MKKTIIILCLVLGVVTLVGAQEENSGEFNNETTCYKYKFSLNLGRGFVDPNIVSFPAYPNYSSNVQPVVPYVNGISQTSNSATNMIGVEFRWMFKPNWSLNIHGLAVLTANPEQDAIAGIQDPSYSSSMSEGWIIPNINGVPFEASFDWNIEVGASRYFDMPNINLKPYIGLSFMYAHGSDRFEVPFTATDDYSGSIDPADLRGMVKGEFVSWGFAVPMGMEYYIADGLFIGMSINVVNYYYSLTQIAPGEGMDLARADLSTFSLFTRPLFKIGIAF